MMYNKIMKGAAGKIIPPTILLLFLKTAEAAPPRWYIGIPCTYNCSLCDFFMLIRNMVDFLITYTFLIAVIAIAVGGILIMFSFGSPARLEKGKEAIKAAIIGIVVAIMAWTIISIVISLLTGGSGFNWTSPAC